ncbi:hypothetical protein FOCC_FOCC005647, partial [Frankliniella occidentalis]
MTNVGTVKLHGEPIVSLVMEGCERLCLAQISNTLLRDFSYNEIHNRRVALGITCVQCTPVQLEILRRAGAMPSFLGDNTPPRLPEDFSFRVHHECAWGCRGLFLPARYNSSRAKCIKCVLCGLFFSPNKFIFHSHRTGPAARYVQPDAANFNSWRRHMRLTGSPPEEVVHAWEDVKAMFNGGTRKRLLANSQHHQDRSASKPATPSQQQQQQQQPPQQQQQQQQQAPRQDGELGPGGAANAPPSPVKAHPTSPSGPSPAKMSKSSSRPRTPLDSPPGATAAPPFPLAPGQSACLPPRGLHLEWGPWGRASPLPPLGSPLPPAMAPPPLGPPPHHVLPPYAALPWLAPKRSLLAFSPDGVVPRAWASALLPPVPPHQAHQDALRSSAFRPVFPVPSLPPALLSREVAAESRDAREPRQMRDPTAELRDLRDLRDLHRDMHHPADLTREVAAEERKPTPPPPTALGASQPAPRIVDEVDRKPIVVEAEDATDFDVRSSRSYEDEEETVDIETTEDGDDIVMTADSPDTGEHLQKREAVGYCNLGQEVVAYVVGRSEGEAM